jgi:hypothetical protein
MKTGFFVVIRSTACLIHLRTIDTVILMHRPQFSTPAASIPFILLPDKFVKTVFLNERKIFQHTHVIPRPVPLVQCFQPFTRVSVAFKAKDFLVFAFLNRTVLTGFSFAAMAAAIAGKPLALIGLTQGAVHPAGRDKLLQSHNIFSIKIYRCFAFKCRKNGQPMVDRFAWLRGPDLNQRPSGYEPDELPSCSTPRCILS